jgi:hypothetical protein
MTKQRHDDDDESNVRYHGDGRGPLRDGERLRTPLHLMDGVQREVARHAARITDAMGESGPALRRPGYRISDAFQRDWSVYDAYDEAVSCLWENNPPTGDGSSGPRGAQPGDSCTLDGKRGHLRMIDGELKCVVDASGNDSAMSDEREAAYAAKDEYYRNAWRGGR